MEISSMLVKGSSLMLEIAGILLIAVGALVSTMKAFIQYLQHVPAPDIYRDLRQRLGSGIVLGLEFLVAADIIRTVALEPTFRSAGLLAIIVLIRTFLSFTIQLEVTGKWPWQKEIVSSKQ